MAALHGPRRWGIEAVGAGLKRRLGQLHQPDALLSPLSPLDLHTKYPVPAQQRARKLRLSHEAKGRQLP